jgi:hypothetical protein
MQRRVNNILKKIAQEEKLPYKVVEAVYNSQFKYAKEKISQSEKGNVETFTNVRLPMLGVLKTTESRITKMFEVCQIKE